MDVLRWYGAYWRNKFELNFAPLLLSAGAVWRFLCREWADLQLASEECKIYGVKRFGVNLVSEAMVGVVLVGLLFATTFKPLFGVKPHNWLRPTELSIGFLDEARGFIGLRGLKQDISVPLEAMPKHFLNALLAVEDPTYFENEGFDAHDVMVALNVKEANDDDLTRARPTIALQLARQIFLSTERRGIDQLRENALAFWLNKQFSKQELLKLYVDRTYLGLSSFGASAAAKAYFGKTLQELNLTESAMLAGLFGGADAYSPFENMDRAKGRLQAVLSLMVLHGKISREDAERALNVELPKEQPKLPGRSNDIIRFG